MTRAELIALTAAPLFAQYRQGRGRTQLVEDAYQAICEAAILVDGVNAQFDEPEPELEPGLRPGPKEAEK